MDSSKIKGKNIIVPQKYEWEVYSDNNLRLWTNGSKVEFRRNGAWKEVDCRYSSLPAGIVSMPIETKVQELYPGAAVIKIERDKQEVEVKLNNGMELTFDRSHNLIGIDD